MTKIDAIGAVINALDAGYLDELFTDCAAREAFREDVLGVQIRAAVDDMGVTVQLEGGALYVPGRGVVELREQLGVIEGGRNEGD